MNPLTLFSGDGWQTLATALLHTLWQGAAIGLLLALILRPIPARQATIRYAISLAALIGLLGAGFLTWAILDFKRTGAGSGVAVGTQAPPTATVPPTAGDGSRAIPGSPMNPTPPGAGAGAGDAVSGNAIAGAGGKVTETAREGHDPGAAPQSATRNYRSWVIAGWLAGIVIMLIRMTQTLRDADRLRRRCVAVGDAGVLDMFNSLIQRASTGRTRVRLLAVRELSGPVAMGFLMPAIVLPMSMVTGTSPEILRAILAHELAHIRRHDYLINLGQMLVEAILFFNPAVWWINRQIRSEREACCDAEAARLTGDQTGYVEALASFVEFRRSAAPALAPAFGAEKGSGPGGLTDRVRRLLIPGYRPGLRLPWHGLILFLVAGAVLLTAVHQSARFAVATGAKWLTPEERIARIQEVQKTHSVWDAEEAYDETEARKPSSRVRIFGTIRTEDGSPLTREGLYLNAVSRRPQYTAAHSLRIDGDRFSGEVHPGRIFISVVSEHYAPVFVGPLKGSIGATVPDVEVVLKPGFLGTLKILDTAGQPVRNATISGKYRFEAPAGIAGGETDDRGLFQIPNASSHKAEFQVRAPGFQHDRGVFTLSEDSAVTWTLQPAKPARIRILSDTGDPVAGATARLDTIAGPFSTSYGEGFREVFAVSDPAGMLVFNELRDDSTYWFLLEAFGHHREFLRKVYAAETNRTVRLGDPISVSGTIEGDLEQLPRRWDQRDGAREQRAYIHFSNPKRIDGNTSSNWEHEFVRIEDGRARFTVTNLWPGEISLQAGPVQVTHELVRSLDDIRITLPAPSATAAEASLSANETESVRTVVFRFEAPTGHPVPNGKLQVVHNRKVGENRFDYEELTPDVTDGVAECTVPVGGRISCKPEGFAGYWFEPLSSETIPPGRDPWVRKLVCHPAGAVFGTLSEPDGSPARAVMISIVEEERAPARAHGSLGVPIKNSSGNEDRTDRFTATPLPFGGTYRILAHRNANFVVSDPIKIDEANPIARIDLKLSEGVPATGTILKPDGAPAPGIRFRHSFSLPSHGFLGSEQFTDRLGRWSFGAVNPNAPGVYAIVIDKNPGFQPDRVEFKPDGHQQIIQLKPGHIVSGKVVEVASGSPIPGIEVYAIPIPHSPDRTGFIDADNRVTGTDGTFTFSVLDQDRYRLGVRGGTIADDARAEVRGGQPDHVILPVTLPAGSRFKPGASTGP